MDIPKENLVVEFQIKNFKSYFGDLISLKITKPITIIAGPNGEGKTNLLEAMLVGLSNFVNEDLKLKEKSLFTKAIKISSKPEIHVSLYEYIFTDLIKKNLAETPSKISYPERLDPKNVLSHNQNEGSVLMRISEELDVGNVGKVNLLAEITSVIAGSPPSFGNKNFTNKLECLDLFYLNPDTVLTDLFVKLVGQEFSDQLKGIMGPTKKAKYQTKVLKTFPEDEDRIICEVEDGEFEEKYLEGSNLFLTGNLATGAKKECLLYILSLLAEKHKKKKKWITMFLIDEIEEGLHISRQKKLADALINAFQNNESLRHHVRIVMSTHSPIIYSELMKYPDYADVYFALRNPGESSKLFQSDDIVGNELIEKRILAELGLNIYEFPKKFVFVEGKTDKIFFRNVLEDVGIIPLNGANIPDILSEIIISVPLARSKEYFAVVDQNGLKKVEKAIKELKGKGVDIEASGIGFNSLEEFIFDVNIEEEEIPSIWNKIEERVKELSENVEDSERPIVNINVKAPREKLENKNKDGLIEFFRSMKNKDDFYEVIGKNWSKLLKKRGEEKISELKNIIEK